MGRADTLNFPGIRDCSQEGTDVAESRLLRRRADRILELHEAGDLDGALTACEELIADATPLVHRDAVARESLFAARIERALVLTERGALEAAAQAYAEAAATPYDPEDPDERHEVAMALLNQGICLASIGRAEEALTAYEDLLERFSTADDPVTADQVTRARVNRAVALLELGRLEEAVGAAAQMVATLDALDVLDAEQRVMAARVQAAALHELGQPEAAERILATADDSLAVDAPAVRLQVVAAQCERMELLSDLGRQREAGQVRDRTLMACADADDPDVVSALEPLRSGVIPGW